MDINDLKGLSTVFMMLAFAGICWWAFGPSRRKQFNEAANLPFVDDLEANQESLRSTKSEQGQDKL